EALRLVGEQAVGLVAPQGLDVDHVVAPSSIGSGGRPQASARRDRDALPRVEVEIDVMFD
ncbi:MAG TPA: hypothetical protein VFM27_01395, partial [Acidimicrobiales bacterium]|nr:hypothetical protein [Acidimicrobiales bacterium]